MKRNSKFLKQGIDKNQKQVNDRNTTTNTSTSDNKVTLLYNQEDCFHVADQDGEWIVAQRHHTTILKIEYFSTYKVRDFDVVKMKNKSVSQIVEISYICTQTSTRYTLTLKNV